MRAAFRAARNILRPLPERDFPGRARVHIFIFKLNADHGAAVFKQQSVKLRRDFTIEPPHISQIALVIAAKRKWASIKPIGEAAIATFTVRERANPHKGLKITSVTEGNKAAQIMVACPLEAAFFFLD